MEKTDLAPYFRKGIVSWNEVVEMVDELSESLFPPTREKEYDIILGVQRGGSIVANLLCSTLVSYVEKPPLLSFIPLKYPFNIDTVEENDLIYTLPILKKKRVLLVDDVSVTGNTLRKCKSLLQDLGPASITSAALLNFDFMSAKMSEFQKKYSPDKFQYYIDRMVLTPWKIYPSLRVPFTLNLSCSHNEVHKIITDYSELHDGYIDREGSVIYLSINKDKRDCNFQIILSANNLGVSLRIFLQVIDDNEYISEVKQTLFDQNRLSVAQHELLNLIMHIRENEF